MSDLQCPARLLFVPAATSDREELIEALRGERVTGLWAVPEAEPAAAELAAALGVGVHADERLADSEPADELIEEVADTTRGETTVMLGTAGPLEVLVDGDGVRLQPWP